MCCRVEHNSWITHQVSGPCIYGIILWVTLCNWICRLWRSACGKSSQTHEARIGAYKQNATPWWLYRNITTRTYLCYVLSCLQYTYFAFVRCFEDLHKTRRWYCHALSNIWKPLSWWRHKMDRHSALLTKALCREGTCYRWMGSLMKSFDRFVVLSTGMLLNKQFSGRWKETPQHLCMVIIVDILNIYFVYTSNIIGKHYSQLR